MEMLAGNGGQAEKIFPLPNPDNDAYARRESDDHGRGNKSDDRAHACQTEQQQNNAGHKGGNLQAVDAMLSDDTCLNKIGRASCKGKSVSVRVDLGGRRIIKKKKNKK